MKATGIISRVDDLGRVRIPKELRRQLEIKEMDAIEFFIDGKDIVIRKYTFDNCENEAYNCDACVKNGDCVEQGIDGEVMEHCVQGSCSNFKSVEQIKAEAYKEFAERLKQSTVMAVMGNKIYAVATSKGVDNLLKELVGEE